MALADKELDIILDRMIESYPGDELPVPNEVEFALVGYTNEGQFDKNWNLGIARFGQILKGFLKEQFKENPDPVVMITISSNDRAIEIPNDAGKARARVTDDGTGKVAREFCITNICKDEHTNYELKKRLNKVDMPEYGIRLRYSTEEALPDENIIQLKEVITSKRAPKKYRYAQRYSIDLGEVGERKTKLKVDFSSVKANDKDAYSFSGAQIVGMCANKARDVYEIEVELSNTRGVTKEDLEAARKENVLGKVLQYLITQVQGGTSNHIHNGTQVAQNLSDYVTMCHRLWPKLPDVRVGTYISQKILKDLSPYFLGPQIATINRNTLKDGILLPKDDGTPSYYFTDKADGERCLMFIGDNGDCSLVMKSGLPLGKRNEGLVRTLNFVPTDLNVTVPKLAEIFDDSVDYRPMNDPIPDSRNNGTVLDGELLKISDKYYYLAFDIIVYMGQYVNLSKFEHRYVMLQAITAPDTDSPTLSLKAKTFLPYDTKEFQTYIGNTTKFNIVPDKIHGIDSINFTDNGIKYKLDGIVFQPADELYPVLAVSWHNVFKYKPMSMLTVDLHLGYDRKMPKSNSNELGITQTENPDVYGIFSAAHKCHPKSRTCRGSGNLDESPYPCYARITNGYPRTESGEVINRGNIVECHMVITKGKPYWEPMRVRHDKHMPNSYMVHDEVLKQLYEPILLENFYEENGGFGGKHTITDHNRWVSNRFIIATVRRISKGDVRLLDFACGNIKSGNSWIALQKGYIEDSRKRSGQARTLKIVGVDNCKDSATNIATSHVYMSNINTGSGGMTLFKPGSYGFYQENILHPLHQSEDIELREQVMTPESFNVVTCIFAIYYTFGSEENFRSFLSNVSRNLKTGGLFICSYMNGKNVRELIKKSGGGVATGGKIWKLKQMKDPDHSPFGHQVKVSFDGLYKDNIEYLVDLNDPNVLMIIREYGFEVYKNVQSGPFITKNEKLTLTPDEQIWASLHENICFVKNKVDNTLDVYDRMFKEGVNFTPTKAPKAPDTNATAEEERRARIIATAKAKIDAKGKDDAAKGNDKVTKRKIIGRVKPKARD